MSEWKKVSLEVPRVFYPVHAVNIEKGYEAIMSFDGVEWHELDRSSMSRGIGFYPTHWKELGLPPKP